MNPNSPEVVSSDLLLPNVMRSTTNEIAEMLWGIGNVWMQYSAKIQLQRDPVQLGRKENPYKFL